MRGASPSLTYLRTVPVELDPTVAPVAPVAGGDDHRWDPWPAVDVPRSRHRWVRALDLIALAAVAVAGLVLRVWQRSPLWLDEALSANIAALPLSDIPGALRRDGHPPLYYVVLHVWQDVVGDGDTAVRLLSAIVGLALIPLAWDAAGRIGGRRAAWAAALLVALNPFVLRYATEARMYEMVMVLVLAGWLVADHALRRPDLGRLALVALLTGVLLWTHYWGLWLTAAAGLGLLVRAGLAHRRHQPRRRAASLRVAGALVVGGLTFVPWLPTLLFQSSHTGTPWAEPAPPTEIAATSLIDLGGGRAGESVLLAMLLALLCGLGLFAAPGRGSHVELDLRTRPEVRRLALLIVGTMGVAVVVSYLAQAAYATRYFSAVSALVLVLAGVGASRIGGVVAFRVVLAAALILGAASGIRAAVSLPRTQAREVAQMIMEEEAGPATGPSGPLVLVCPDQLGPALSRELPPTTDLATYPRFEAPELVDWVDYQDRLDAASPEAFVAEALERGEGRDVWLVWMGTYRTHAGVCERLVAGLRLSRPAAVIEAFPQVDAFEQANVYRFPPVPPA